MMRYIHLISSTKIELGLTHNCPYITFLDAANVRASSHPYHRFAMQKAAPPQFDL